MMDVRWCVGVPANMAKLPAQLLVRLKGSFAEPNFLPTMSARPSPPHMREMTIMPIGDCRQKTIVAAVMITT